MRHLKSILYFFLLVTLNSFSQFDYRKGYIVQNNNDTIYGYIDYKGNKSNAKICNFKNSQISEKQEFDPSEITSYKFNNGKYYVAKTLTDGTQTKSLFLEYLINGIIDIYYYRDGQGEHYMAENQEGKLLELKNEQTVIVIDHKAYNKNSKEYVGVLKNMFKESPTVVKKVDETGLSHTSLINIAKDFHNAVCFDYECVVYEKSLRKTMAIFGVVAGMTHTTLVIDEDFQNNIQLLKGSDYGAITYPSLGFYLKVQPAYFNEKIFLQYEGTYSRMHLTSYNSYVDVLYNMPVTNDISLKQNVFRNAIFMKYEFPKGKLRPTFQIGGFLNNYFGTKYNRDFVIKTTDGEVFGTNSSQKNEFKKIDAGFNFGIGLKTIIVNNKELFMDLRYQRGYGLLESVNTDNISLNLGLQIGK